MIINSPSRSFKPFSFYQVYTTSNSRNFSSSPTKQCVTESNYHYPKHQTTSTYYTYTDIPPIIKKTKAIYTNNKNNNNHINKHKTSTSSVESKHKYMKSMCLNNTEKNFDKFMKYFGDGITSYRSGTKRYKSRIKVENFFHDNKLQYIKYQIKKQDKICNDISNMNKQMKFIRCMCDYIVPYVRKAKESRNNIMSEERQYKLSSLLRNRTSVNYNNNSDNNTSRKERVLSHDKTFNITGEKFKVVKMKDYLKVNTLYRTKSGSDNKWI